MDLEQGSWGWSGGCRGLQGSGDCRVWGLQGSGATGVWGLQGSGDCRGLGTAGVWGLQGSGDCRGLGTAGSGDCRSSRAAGSKGKQFLTPWGLVLGNSSSSSCQLDKSDVQGFMIDQNCPLNMEGFPGQALGLSNSC